MREAYYRPFVPMKLYFNRVFNGGVYRLFDIFPTADAENIAIVVSDKGKGRVFDAFMVDEIVDVSFFTTSVAVFPLYYFAGDGSRRENITAGAVGILVGSWGGGWGWRRCFIMYLGCCRRRGIGSGMGRIF
jgi:predicted helicase